MLRMVIHWIVVGHLTLGAAAAVCAQQPERDPQQPASAPASQSLIVVVGAPGADSYGQVFAQSAAQLVDLCRDHAIDCTSVGTTEADQDDFETLRRALQKQPLTGSEPLWIVLLGHGTFDGRVAKFNLRGPDLSAEQLQQWLEPFERTVVIVNCASASSPFMSVLKGPNRVVITSTKSGYQYNFARLGEYFTAALGDPAADLDKDGQTSLLEAYLLASSQVEEFYQQESRLATEQALLDDNGDGRGTPASWFRGVRAVQRAKDNAPVDGTRAHQLHLVRSALEEQLDPDTRKRRDELERQVAELRELKPTLAENDYYDRLQHVLVELAQLYEDRESDG